MARVSKKRERTSDEDVVDTHDATLVLKKSKLDSTGKAEVTKKSAKEDKPKKEKKDESEKKEKKDKKDKKDKKEKKDKKKKSDPEAATETANKSTSTAPEPTSDSTVKPVKDSADDATKSKKDKKKTKKKSKAPAQDETPTEQDGRQPEEEQAEEEPATNGKPTRFICFVGNLPFTATADSVRAHFATLQPTSVRLLTQRDNPSKSRGIAFVEFGRYDHMKTCLEKFHHTEFDDGKSAARRINVELTYVSLPNRNSCPTSSISSLHTYIHNPPTQILYTANMAATITAQEVAAKPQRAATRSSKRTPSSTRSGRSG